MPHLNFTFIECVDIIVLNLVSLFPSTVFRNRNKLIQGKISCYTANKALSITIFGIIDGYISKYDGYLRYSWIMI